MNFVFSGLQSKKARAQYVFSACVPHTCEFKFNHFKKMGYALDEYWEGTFGREFIE
jgi:hypothetical protein